MSHHRHRVLLVLLCSPALWVTGARAAIPSSVKQSTSPTVIDTAVQSFISGEIAKLRSKTPATQKMAKEALIAECTGRGDVTATPEYQVAYARQLNQQLAPLLQDKAIRVRLTAAIIATQVAADTVKTDAPAQFASMATALMKDKEDSILLWGVKLAKYVIADLAQQGKSIKPLSDQVIAAVKNHPDSGYLAEEAYAALTLEPYQNQNPDGFTKATPVVLKELLNLMDTRTAQYATAVPGSPQAEDKAVSFLAVKASQVAGAAPMRGQVLGSLGRSVCAVLTQIANGNTAPELVSVARSEGGALEVFGTNFGNSALSDVGKAISSITANTPSNALTAHCSNLENALKGMQVILNPAPAGGAAASDLGK